MLSEGIGDKLILFTLHQNKFYGVYCRADSNLIKW